LSRGKGRKAGPAPGKRSGQEYYTGNPKLGKGKKLRKREEAAVKKKWTCSTSTRNTRCEYRRETENAYEKPGQRTTLNH